MTEAVAKKKIPTQDVIIIVLVSLMSIGANLPEDVSKVLGINRNFLIVGLIAIVVISLVRYLKFTLILVIAILCVGANLPGDVAEKIGVDPQIMLFSLVAMVVTSFVNFILKLPKGVKPLAQVNSTHGSRALCQAAYKGHASMVYSLISAGINPNFPDEKGHLPLVVAASQGHALVVKLLLDNGANAAGRDGTGVTALAAAQTGQFTQTATLVKNAIMRQQAQVTAQAA